MIKSYILFAILLCFSCKSIEETNPTHEFVLKHTWPEVLAIAQKHGVDSTYIPYDKQSALMLDEEEEIVQFVLNVKHSLDTRKQRREFMSQVHTIRSYADYEALLSQYPLVLEAEIRAYGGIAVYEKHQQEFRSVQWHIYCNSIGTIGWVRPQDDEGSYQDMERIDNKPRVVK
jgi:hypothetical protein